MRRLLIAGALLASGVVAGFVAASPAAAEGATVSVDRGGTAEGEDVVVTGTGWPKGTTVVVELCGQEGRNGSVDCDVANQQVAGTGDDGVFRAVVPVGRPPAPCPCVMRAVDQRSPLQAAARIGVQGMATVPLAEDPIGPRPEVRDVRLLGGGVRWGELFGGRPQRTLRFTLANTGDQPLVDAELTVTVGRGSDPSQVVEAPALPTVAPGQSVVQLVPVELDVLSIGRHSVVVEVRDGGERVRASAATSTYPWALVAVAVLLVQLVLLGLRNRARRRIHPDDADGTDDGDPPTVEPDEPPTVIERAEPAEASEPDDEAGDPEEEVDWEAVRLEVQAVREETDRIRTEAHTALTLARDVADAIVTRATERAADIVERGLSIATGGREPAAGDWQEELLAAAVDAVDEAQAKAASADAEVDHRLDEVDVAAALLDVALPAPPATTASRDRLDAVEL